MPKLRWTLESTYHDTEHNFRAVGPGVYDVPEDRVEKYLSHRLGGWERVDDEQDTIQDDTEDDDVDDIEEASQEGVEEDADETLDQFQEALEDGDPEPLPFNPEELTNSEIEEEVAEIDDEETLVALRNLEQDQQDRKGATDAIEARLEEVREE